MARLFWGPSMCELLDELDSRSVIYGTLHPSDFVHMMNELTNETVPERSDPEDSAKIWLNKLKEERAHDCHGGSQ